MHLSILRRRPGRVAAVALPLLAVMSLPGCGGSPPAPPPRAVAVDRDHDHDHDHDDRDHDDHGHPANLPGTLAEVKTLWGKIRESLEKGDRDAADDSVHEAGHLLEDRDELVAGVDGPARDAVRKSLDDVFDCFDALDVALHGEEDAWKKLDLDGLGKRLSDGFAAIEAVLEK